MTRSNKLSILVVLSIVLYLIPVFAFAERASKDKVVIDYIVLENGTCNIVDAYNNSPNRIRLYVDNTEFTINAGSSAKINKVAKRLVRFDSKVGGQTLLRCPVSRASETTDEAIRENEPVSAESPIEEIAVQRKSNSKTLIRPAKNQDLISATDWINQDDYFGEVAIACCTQKVDTLIKALSQSENKEQFLIDNDIKKYLSDSKTELEIKKSEIADIAQEFVASLKISDPKIQDWHFKILLDTLTDRCNQRQLAYDELQNAVDSIADESGHKHLFKDDIINYSIIGVIVLVLVIWMIVTIRKKSRKKQRDAQVQSKYDNDPNNPAIVVRRRTTSILKKQSIDDVINNPEYMLIDSSDFTPDSAVRKIYIKNTCIKDVYNLYADDLRNSDNPMEDGCMVLGRWVRNDETNTYDISLETVVFPGDDAVFKEYELNFGGKIKLRIAEKLRKLRRETNLQYDLVCWIHSHPGLGVFFSNSDVSVQMQLKHSQHPNFLIAFVVDILTSNQELGIFTFRKDGSMNSKGELIKMYSLEDMYKWALGSDKATFNPDNYYNILASSKMQMPACKGIELNNSSIIDLTQIVIEPTAGVVGWAIGTTVDVKGETKYVVSSIVKTEEKPSAGVVGVLLNVTHMSLPTIQRLISNENIKPSFILVYSSKQNTLTSIPVINGELITDEHFYGEETIDDLKIWTRRKR